jgi:HEPN domain-containing protein
MMEVPSKSIRRLIKNISSNNIRAQHAEQDADSRSELRHHLWASRDIHRLLLLWNDGKGGIDDSIAKSYAESVCHTAERIRELVAARAER